MGEEYVQWTKDELKLDGITLPSRAGEVEDAVEKAYLQGNAGPIGAMVLGNDYDPLLMGHIAGFRVMLIASSDGWNSNGSLQYSRELNATVPCTGSCRKFQDTTGYAPMPNPRTY